MYVNHFPLNAISITYTIDRVLRPERLDIDGEFGFFGTIGNNGMLFSRIFWKK